LVGGRMGTGAHFIEADPAAAARNLPGCLRAGQPPADNNHIGLQSFAIMHFAQIPAHSACLQSHSP